MAKEFRFGYVIDSDAEKPTKSLRRVRQEAEKLQSQTDKTSKSSDKWNRATKRQNEALRRAKTLVAGFAGAAGLGALTLAIGKNQRAFGAAVSNLSAITGAVGKDLEFLSDQARDIGKTTTLSATQAVDAFKLIASAKPDLLQSAAALNEVTREAVTLSEAAKIDLTSAADVLGTSLNQFQAGAGQASRFINVLAAGAQLGASAIADTSLALKNVGAAANAAGVDFETTNAAIQALAAGGLKAAEAGTGLRNVILFLEQEADKNLRPSVVGLTQALENLAEKELSITELTDIFGRQNVIAAQTLVDQIEIVKDLETNLRDTSTAYEQASTNVDNLDGDILSMQSAFEGLTLTLGTKSEPAMRGFIQATNHTIVLVDGLAQDSMPALNTIIALTATTIMTRFVPAMAAATGPIGLVTAAVVTLTFAYQNLEEVDKRVAKNVFDRNVAEGSRVIELAMYDLAQQIAEVSEEMENLGNGRTARHQRVRLEQELQDLIAQMESYSEALREAKLEQIRTEEWSGYLADTLDEEGEAVDRVLQKYDSLAKVHPVLRNEVELVTEGVGVLSLATQNASVQLLDMDAVITSMQTGRIPGLNTVLETADFRMKGVQDSTSEANTELDIQRTMVEGVQRRWADLIGELVRGKADVGDFFDTFAKGIAEVVFQAGAADLMSLFTGGQGGNLAGLFNGQFPAGNSGQGGNSLFSSIGSSAVGTAVGTGISSLSFGATQAATLGKASLGVGNSMVSPELARQALGQSAGGLGGTFGKIGSLLNNPVGWAIGAALVGKFVHDATNDPDGFHRGMAGFLGAPTPGAPMGSQFAVQKFASGFQPIGFADGPASIAQANSVIDQFRFRDQLLFDAVAAAGGKLLAPQTLAGFGVDGIGAGTFFGKTQRTTDPQFMAQLSSFTNQLLTGVSGLPVEVMKAITSTSDFEQVLSILHDAATGSESVVNANQTVAEKATALVRSNTGLVDSQGNLRNSNGELVASMSELIASQEQLPATIEIALISAYQRAQASSSLATVSSGFPGASSSSEPLDPVVAEKLRQKRVQGNLDRIAKWKSLGYSDDEIGPVGNLLVPLRPPSQGPAPTFDNRISARAVTGMNDRLDKLTVAMEQVAVSGNKTADVLDEAISRGGGSLSVTLSS